MIPAGDELNLADLLTRAFGIVIDTIDTNPYRKAQRQLSIELERTTTEHGSADGEAKYWAQKYEVLAVESREAGENEIAYETFAARTSQFLPEHRNAPRAAKEWAQAQLVDDRKAVVAHNEKVVALAGKFETWMAANAKHAGESLPDALAILVERHEKAVAAGDAAREAMVLACKHRDELRPTHKAESLALRAADKTHQRLTGLAEALPAFRTLFGDVDPLQQNPQAELATTNRQCQDASDRLKAAIAVRDKLDGLKPMIKVFREVFGDTDPATLSPVQDLLDQKSKIAIEEAILTDHQPHIEALSQFRDAYGKETPDHRLEAIGQQRSELLTERASIKTHLGEINVDLSDLDTYAVADGRVYAAALDALTKAGVPFTRLHTVAMDEAGDRRAAMLSLFSAALSAPVVKRLEDADRATEILENAKLTVPVFLADPLRQFVQGGGYEVTGNITHTFFAGRSTQQVKILLNPKLVVEEKERLNAEAKGLSGRDTEIGRLLAEIDPSTDLVAMVLKARDAIQKGSEAKYAEAEGRLGGLSKLLPTLQRRVESVDSIRVMKEFAALGGDNTWQELVAKTIPHEQAEVFRIELIVGRLTRLVEEDASRALLAAKDFYREGGENALTQAAAAVARLEPLVADLADQLKALQIEIEGPLAVAQQSASEALAALNRTFALDKRDLQTAIEFEANGSVEFMREADGRGGELQAAVSASITRLQDIDFERAQRYIDASKAEGLALADRIAEAKGKRDAAAEKRGVAESTLKDLNGRLSALQPFVDDLHDAVVEIREQYAKVAAFSDDIRFRVAAGKAHPEIIGYAETLQIGCLGKLPSTSGETKAAIANLRESVKELNIDTKMLVQRRQTRGTAQTAFTEERNRFCEQARDGRIKGLQLPEIDRIAEATNRFATVGQEIRI